jgi:Prealbumin-like fold domain
MSLLSRLFRPLRITQSRRPHATRPLGRARPAFESLEGRCVPTAGATAIASNFNGTAIPAGGTVWFNSAFKANGLGSAPVTLQFTNQTVTFSAGGTPYTVNVPNATVTFSPSATLATTTFNAGTNAWDTTLPMHFSGNGFLSGVALAVPSGLPGGINPVTWQGQMSSDTAGVSVNWQWAAAVYKSFGSDYNTLNVKPVDDNQASAYQNSDHAGTPEAFTAYVTGGARGGGGSNYTGSESSTASLTPPVVTAPPPPASVSGFVFDSTTGLGLAGATITITGTTTSGQNVSLTVTTDSNGYYQFGNLAAGTYTLTETAAPGNYGGAGAFFTLTVSAGQNVSNENFHDAVPMAN